jgi:esterase/lipase
MQFVQEHANELDINSLYIQGDCDSLTNMNGSQLIYDNIKSTKKQIHILEGGYHELLNDTTSEKYIDIVVNYLSN